MALTKYDLVRRALDLLRAGLGPYVEREMRRAVNCDKVGDKWRRLQEEQRLSDRPVSEYDAAELLKVLEWFWHDVFRARLGKAEQGYVMELRTIRNKWAHQEPFSDDDVHRALDTASRLLSSTKAFKAAEQVKELRAELRSVTRSNRTLPRASNESPPLRPGSPPPRTESKRTPPAAKARSQRRVPVARQKQHDELDLLSEDELEEILFDEEESPRQGPFNLPTMAGLSLVLVGLVYLLQQLNVLSGFSLATLVSWLPWIAGVLIVLLGFGVLSWRPQKKSRRMKRRRGKPARLQPPQEVQAPASGPKKKLHKSHERKIAGICGGLAEYFNLSPTYVRLAFFVATLFTPAIGPIAPVAYLVLAFIMPRADATGTGRDRNASGEAEISIDSRDVNINIYK